MTAPFVDAGEVEVCARVFTQLVKAQYRKSPKGTAPAAIVQAALNALPASPPSTMTLAAYSFWYHVIRLECPSWRWLDEVIKRDRIGYALRAALYFEYKGTRRNPRVTNRGVRH